MTVPPPIPPIYAKKPDRPRAVPVVKPAVRIITANTTNNKLFSVEKQTQDEVDNGDEPT